MNICYDTTESEKCADNVASRVYPREPRQPPVVWTAVGNSMLVERMVEPIQTVEGQTYLAPTLDPEARVITTDLRVQTDSMRIRPAQQ